MQKKPSRTITLTEPQTQVGRVSKNECPKTQVLFFFFPYPAIIRTSGNLIHSVLSLDSSQVPCIVTGC